MEYSIIISYRDRENHLQVLLPRLREMFIDHSYEIIVAEQYDRDKFQKNSLYNIAALEANGDLLVFHDVDYYPSDNVNYDTDETTPLYPARNVVFLDQNNEFRKETDIPAGYRNFINDVGDHSGGVFVLHRELFHSIGGLNPYYKGWGKEDDDTRDRLRLLGYSWKRNDIGLFYALYHEDNKPKEDDSDFLNNGLLLYNIKNNLSVGYKNVKAKVIKYNIEDVVWLKINNFEYSFL